MAKWEHLEVCPELHRIIKTEMATSGIPMRKLTDGYLRLGMAAPQLHRAVSCCATFLTTYEDELMHLGLLDEVVALLNQIGSALRAYDDAMNPEGTPDA